MGQTQVGCVSRSAEDWCDACVRVRCSKLVAALRRRCRRQSSGLEKIRHSPVQWCGLWEPLGGSFDVSTCGIVSSDLFDTGVWNLMVG